MDPLIILMVIVSIIWYVFYYLRRDLRKYAATIPSLEGSYPIVGYLQVLSIRSLQRLSDTVWDISQQHCTNGVLKTWVGPNLVVLINSPKYLQAMVNYSQNKGILYQKLFGKYPNGVFVTNDYAKWKELRKPLNKMLSKKIIDSDHSRIFIKRIKHFIEFLRDKRCGKEVNLLQDVKHFVFDVFIETNIGIKTCEVEESKLHFAERFVRNMDATISGSMRELIFSYFIKQQGDKYLKEVDNFISEILEERSKDASAWEGDLKYYADFLLRRMKEKNMNLEDIKHELADVIIAGVDTSPVAGSNALVFLAAHPEIQEAAYEEQIAILGEHLDSNPTFEELSSMVLLDRIFKETLRLSSPEAAFRQTDQHVKLDDNYTIPKGTQCIFHLSTISLDKRYWERATEFYPDHFLPEKEAERHPYAYTPFGFGPRICPGSLYAKRLMLLFLSYILRNFKISTKMKMKDFKFQNKFMREIANAKLELHKREIT